MRKYFTWRCIGLHLLTIILVPTFLLAGWWQYHVALSGNDLSWVYTVEWPVFSIYAIYMWWQLIHDQRTPFDRLWAAKQRAAADASGRPLHQIPGWALDKTLTEAVVNASIEAARAPVLAAGNHPDALGSDDHGLTYATRMTPELGNGEVLGNGFVQDEPVDDRVKEYPLDDSESVIDVRVLEVKTVLDEELDAYNRYLAELSRKDSSDRRASPRR